MTDARTSGVGARPQLIVLAMATFAGAALEAAGWWNTSGTRDVSEQMVGLDIATGGTIILAAAQGWWLYGQRRRFQLALRSAVAGSPEALLSGPPVLPDAPPQRAVHAATPVPVATEAMRLFHRPDCELALGKALRPVSELRTTGRRPCGMCRP
ncbi:MAG TPA: hypothetical protein VHY21_15530 [Pseudonocardiaceae bacterium]|jgi:hypothetical protein|nr:hypothetical protein [Pseudonocardiaceae bacterium]